MRTELIQTELIRTELVRTELVRTELKAQIKTRQPEELKVLLMAVRYWDSLKS